MLYNHIWMRCSGRNEIAILSTDLIWLWKLIVRFGVNRTCIVTINCCERCGKNTLPWPFLIFSTHQIKCSRSCLMEYLAGVVRLLHEGKEKRSCSWCVVCGKYDNPSHTAHLTPYDIRENVQAVEQQLWNRSTVSTEWVRLPNGWSTALLRCGLGDKIAPIQPCFHGIAAAAAEC